MRIFFIGFFVAFLLAMGVDGHAYAEEMPTFSIVGVSNRVQVTDGGNLVAQPDGIVDYMIDEMMNSGKVIVYDNSAYVQKFVADEKSIPVSDEQFMKALPEIHTDYMIYAVVDNLSVENSMSMLHIQDSEDDFMRNGGKIRAVLAMTIVDVKAGKPVYHAVGSGESGVSEVGIGHVGHMISVGQKNVPEECVHNALIKAVHELMEKMFKQI